MGTIKLLQELEYFTKEDIERAKEEGAELGKLLRREK